MHDTIHTHLHTDTHHHETIMKLSSIVHEITLYESSVHLTYVHCATTNCLTLRQFSISKCINEMLNVCCHKWKPSRHISNHIPNNLPLWHWWKNLGKSAKSQNDVIHNKNKIKVTTKLPTKHNNFIHVLMDHYIPYHSFTLIHKCTSYFQLKTFTCIYHI